MKNVCLLKIQLTLSIDASKVPVHLLYLLVPELSCITPDWCDLLIELYWIPESALWITCYEKPNIIPFPVGSQTSMNASASHVH